MIKHELRMSNGDLVIFIASDDGRYACPVCGEWLDDPAWHPNTGRFEDKNVPVACTYRVCPRCMTQFGVDDGAAPTAPPGRNQELWHSLRIAWLKKESWSTEAMNQLRTNLLLDTDQITPEPTR